jgi:hypothetical protein
MQKLEVYLNQLREWEYCYCRNCERIRYSFELEITERGIRCSKCGGYDLEAPAWVNCPHQKSGAVKCPRGGKGIKIEGYGNDCKYRCNFRMP